jgi:phosphonate transport system substrate-binding protein
VQARLQVPGAVPLVQRDIDAQFRSVFIATARAGVQPFTDVGGLAAVAGRSLTFGSESSTSGRLMPQHFLEQAGVGLNRLKGQPGFSGSHDATIKLVESGAFDVGAVNAAVWDDRTKNGKVDQTKVREVFRTPPFHDYHWLIRRDVDKRLGSGFTQRATQAFLDIDGGDDQEKQLLTLFQCKGFTTTEAANYQQIESVGRSVGLIK